MEKIATASRIHPLFAAAAVSVIAVSATGVAALTGMLPSSQAETPAHVAPMNVAAQQNLGARQAFDAQQLAAAQAMAQQFSPQALQQPLVQPGMQQALVQQPAMMQPVVMQPAVPVVREPVVQAKPERVIVREIVYRDREPARKPVRRTSTRSYAAHDHQPVYAQAPVVQERKPNYVAIGTGAVVGGLIGNQIGGGNGKKLATLAGIIGGGYVGNEIANRNR